MLTGSWGILITLSGVDDIRNDDDVEVGFFANADPIQLSPLRAPLSYGTYAIDQDPRFRAKAHGRIKDGVLPSDPVDVRFHNVVNSMRLERALDHARVRMTRSEEHTSELQSLMRISYAAFCLNKSTIHTPTSNPYNHPYTIRPTTPQ